MLPQKQVADQRTARFPVTFALHVVLLLEHNRCCVEFAPTLGYEGDEVSGRFNLAMCVRSFPRFVRAGTLRPAPPPADAQNPSRASFFRSQSGFGGFYWFWFPSDCGGITKDDLGVFEGGG